MKKTLNFKFSIIAVLLVFLSFCNTTVSNIESITLSKESKTVRENGSRPLGFFKALSIANISPDSLNCNSQNRYSKELKPFSKVSAKILYNKISPFIKTELNESQNYELNDILEDHVMWAMVRGVLIEGNNNNLGAIVLKNHFWTDKNGRKQPLVIFRTAFTPFPQKKHSCFSTLLKNGKIKHIINLYDGEMNLKDLIKAERETSERYGATYVRTAELNYGYWRSAIRKHPEKGPELSKATDAVARLIREQILKPKGKAPRGNILIHCGGGMHRTGMIVGILMKVFNNATDDLIINTYKYHTGYRNKENTGGF